MKTTIFVFLLIFGISFSTRAQFVSADVGLNGLTCSMCARGTEASLRSLPFIDSISIDLNSLVAHITFKKGANVSIDGIREMVDDAGFSVRSIDAVFNFNHVTIGNDRQFVFGGNTYRLIGVKSPKTLSGPVKLEFIDKPYLTSNAYKKVVAKYGSASEFANNGNVTGKLYRVTL
jgi:copper chaperone CopZ